jgi:hypothetical protein
VTAIADAEARGIRRFVNRISQQAKARGLAPDQEEELEKRWFARRVRQPRSLHEVEEEELL